MDDAKEGRKKNVGPRSKAPIQVPVTDEERATIQRTARAVRLPVAAYLRDLGLRYQPPSLIDQETLGEAFRIRGDLGRLGGLFKLWLVDAPGKGMPEREVRAALDRTLELQGQMAELIGLLRETITIHRDR